MAKIYSAATAAGYKTAVVIHNGMEYCAIQLRDEIVVIIPVAGGAVFARVGMDEHE